MRITLEFTPKILLPLSSVLLSLGIIIYFSVRGKKNALMYSYFFMQFTFLLWSLGQTVEFMAVSLRGREIAILIIYGGACFVGLSWLIFSILYTERTLSKRLFFLLAIPPIVSYILVITNKYHYLFFSVFEFDHLVYNKLYLFHMISSFLYILAGIIMLIIHYRKQLVMEKKQTKMLILAAIIPGAVNFAETIYVYFSKATNILDFTPTSLSVAMGLFTLAAYKYRFLNILPIALRKIVDNMNEAIVVVDKSNRLVDYNSCFETTFRNGTVIKKSLDIKEIVDAFQININEKEENDRVINAILDTSVNSTNGELSIEGAKSVNFQVKIQPLYKLNKVIGRIISFSDITEYKHLLRELHKKNTELISINEELTAINEHMKEHASMVEELAVTRERNRLAREVHDTLGHTLTMLITTLEVSRITCRKEADKTEHKLNEAINVAKEGLNELRRSVSGLSVKVLESNDFLGAIRAMISDFKELGVIIDLSIEGSYKITDIKLKNALYRICQEAVTNAVRHGLAKKITLLLCYMDDRIKLFIADDGLGCKNIKKGIGLSGMEQRVKEYKGNIHYGSGDEKGFNVFVEIPYKN